MRHTAVLSLACVCLLALLFLVWRELLLLPDGKLHMHTFDVGQGDAILLVSPTGKQVLIDGGPNMFALEHLPQYMSFFDRTLEMVVLTHPDADHVTALPEILRRYTVETVVMAGAEHHSGRYEALLDLLAQTDTKVVFPDPDVDLVLDDNLILDVVWPTPDVFGKKPKNVNDTSVVIRVLYGNDSILLTGDIEEPAETAILQMGTNIEANVLKAGHHGSRTSSSTGFLLGVSPELVVISAGRENRFGHPHAEILNRYSSQGITIRNTAVEGTVSLDFDGI